MKKTLAALLGALVLTATPVLAGESKGCSAPAQECLDYIDEVWTDMRPLSLRKKMEEAAQRKS